MESLMAEIEPLVAETGEPSVQSNKIEEPSAMCGIEDLGVIELRPYSEALLQGCGALRNA